MIPNRRFQVPRANRSVLAIPPSDEVGSLLERNRQIVSAHDVRVAGIALLEWRSLACQEAISLAQGYLRSLGDAVQESPSERLLLSGHQPELSHPGVWVKNFALNALAHQHGLTPLNLIVDNDTLKSTSLRVPVTDDDPTQVRREAIPFDRFAGEVPFEERTVVDPDLWRTLPERAATIFNEWAYEPLLTSFWKDVLISSRDDVLIGERFAVARRAAERRWGCHNLEVPLSLLCESEAFRLFTRHLLAELPRFHESYNRAVQEYRQAHGIRNRQQPVPELEQRGDEFEAPFWVWEPGGQRRQRLFLRPDGEVPGHVKLRSRALTTTLFARLALGDAFIHGIGGGKYDEVTDAIIADFFQMPPPGFLVLSATLHLPLPGFPASADDVARLAQRERDLTWNPQRYSDELTDLANQKNERLLEVPRDRLGRRRRFRELRALTEAMREQIADQRQAATAARQRAEAEVEANAILRSREYAAVLFPEAMLREFLVDCVQGNG